MKVYTLEATQNLNLNLEQAWDFFSSPKNLQLITPPSLNLVVTNNTGAGKMYDGMIITYKVKPLLNIPMTWLTEIKHVNEPFYFIDEQRFGPYAFWHHKHFFTEIPGGVEMKDLVHYGLPYGVFGRMVHPIVKAKLKEIFDYRVIALDKMFGLK